MLLSAGYQNKINLFIYSRLQKSPLPLQFPCEQVSAFCSPEGWCCIVRQMFSEKVHLQGLKVYRKQNLELPNVGEISLATQHRFPEDPERVPCKLSRPANKLWILRLTILISSRTESIFICLTLGYRSYC